VLEAGAGAAGTDGGRVAASGPGWAWLRQPTGPPIHLTGRSGPRTPLSAVVAAVPALRPGTLVRLDCGRARAWRTPAPPAAVDPERRRAACALVEGHGWNDPRARALGREPLEALLPDLVGRGPGLTPAGDDALLGFLLARRALDPVAARADGARVLAAARGRTGAVSLALLRWAARGEGPAPAAALLAALLRGDGPALAPALRALERFGRTTGPAIATGMIGGLGALGSGR
jgi:Protein of unknown function (DUF2877)